MSTPLRDENDPGRLSLPRVFGDYHLLALLAQGGMGSIFLAKRTGFRPDIQHFCVVKTLGAQGARGDLLRRFHDEARVVVTLNHPGICHVFDVGIVDGAHYLAMELIEGVSLSGLQRALAAAGERVPPALALTIIDAVLEALDYAHLRRDPGTGRSLDIVHRDVSPQNVMLALAGAVKLIDFGLVTSALKTEQTVGGLVAGKLGYMSPEQARGEALDARTDVYAAGVLLFELITGQRFYRELGKNAIMLHLTEGSWTPPLDDVPVALRAPLAHALAPERADRSPSAAAFQAELASVEHTRATPRELRALLERVVPDERERLGDIMRGAVAVRVSAADEVTRSVITHVACSDEHPAPIATTHDATHDANLDAATAAPPPAPAVTPRRLLALAAVAAACAVLPIALWAWLRSPAVDLTARAAPDPAPSVAARPLLPEPPPPHLPARDVEADVEPDLQPDVASRAKPDVPPALARPHRPARPPAAHLSDLAAQLEYLERWCTTRAPQCARSVLEQRSRVPLLDPAGLSSLRREAESCVVQCQR